MLPYLAPLHYDITGNCWIKTNLKGKKKKAKKAAAAPAPEAGPVLPKDAVSVGLLVKAKKLVQELGGVKEAKTALNALAQLLD